jgi:hypothetical protein
MKANDLGWEHINFTGDYLWLQSKREEIDLDEPVTEHTPCKSVMLHLY